MGAPHPIVEFHDQISICYWFNIQFWWNNGYQWTSIGLSMDINRLLLDYQWISMETSNLVWVTPRSWMLPTWRRAVYIKAVALLVHDTQRRLHFHLVVDRDITWAKHCPCSTPPQKMRTLLVGGLNPSKKNISQLGWLFPIYGKIKLMFQTTNQMRILLLTWSYLFEVFPKDTLTRGWNSQSLWIDWCGFDQAMNKHGSVYNIIQSVYIVRRMYK